MRKIDVESKNSDNMTSHIENMASPDIFVNISYFGGERANPYESNNNSIESFDAICSPLNESIDSETDEITHEFINYAEEFDSFTHTEIGQFFSSVSDRTLNPKNHLNSINNINTEIDRLEEKMQVTRKMNKLTDTRIRDIINSSKNLTYKKKLEAATLGRAIFHNVLYMCLLEKEKMQLYELFDKKWSIDDWRRRENVWISTYNKEAADYNNLILWLQLGKFHHFYTEVPWYLWLIFNSNKFALIF